MGRDLAGEGVSRQIEGLEAVAVLQRLWQVTEEAEAGKPQADDPCLLEVPAGDAVEVADVGHGSVGEVPGGQTL